MISWFVGMLLWGLWLIPLTIGGVLLFTKAEDNKRIFWLSLILIVIGVVSLIATPLVWHYTIEVDSVNEKVVTVDNWQPRPGLNKNNNGFMVIDSADDLLMVTRDGEGFLNKENFLFGKFDSRDVLNHLKPGSVVKIKYYGWREGFNDGFPNILSVEEVINDTNATSSDLNQYMGNRIVSV